MKFLFLFLATCTCAFSAPGWEAGLSSCNPGSHPPITPSNLEFTLSWKGMVKAGTLNIAFAPRGAGKPGSLVVKSSASSRGAAAALFPFTSSYWSEIHPPTLESRYFHSVEEDAEETTITENWFSASGVRSQEKTTDSKSGQKEARSIVFPYRCARDMFSAILWVRSQKLLPGDEYSLLLMPFKTPYLLGVRVEKKEKHLGHDAIRLSFALRKIDRKTLQLVAYKKLRNPVLVWLSDDDDRFPIELRAQAYIGDVRAIMTGLTRNP